MLLIINAYFLIGLLFGLYFVLRGYRQLDPSAQTAGLIVRLMWLPAAIVLWPALLKKMISGGGNTDQVKS